MLPSLTPAASAATAQQCMTAAAQHLEIANQFALAFYNSQSASRADFYSDGALLTKNGNQQFAGKAAIHEAYRFQMPMNAVNITSIDSQPMDICGVMVLVRGSAQQLSVVGLPKPVTLCKSAQTEQRCSFTDAFVLRSYASNPQAYFIVNHVLRID